MAYELKWTDKKSPDGTGYNDFPLGWREITHDQWAESQFFHHTPVLVESRQMYDKSKKDWWMHRNVSGQLYWFNDGTGIAICSSYERPSRGPDSIYESYKWVLKYFAFGCEHKSVSLSQEECHKRGIYHGGRCYSVSECTKCGNISAVDSSD